MKKKQGSALILVVTLATLLLLVALAATIASVSNVSLTGEEKIKTKLELACEAGLKRARVKIGESFNNGSLKSLTPVISFQGTVADDTGNKPSEKKYDDENYTSGSPGYYSFTYYSSDDKKTITVKYAITEDTDWTIDKSYANYKMNIEVIAYADNYGFVGMSEQAVARRAIPSMYLAFFQDDMEILPDGNTNLKGLIHTNGNLYLNSGNNLNIYTDSMTSAGKIYRGRLDSNSITGKVFISSANDSGDLTEMKKGQDSENSKWAKLAADNWKGSVKDSSIGAAKLEASEVESSIKPGGYYDTNAGLKIKTIGDKYYSNTKYELTYKGKTYTEYNGKHYNKDNSAFDGAVQEIDILDQREGDGKKDIDHAVRVTIVNIDKLKKYYPSNGLIYMTRTDAVADSDGNDYTPDSSRKVTGFQITTNGKSLQAPTTFVSNLPTYVLGTFNQHTDAKPSKDNWQPCGVIADSITLLSDDWDNCAATQEDPGLQKVTHDTEFNAAFITGNIPTKAGKRYNGGLENLPRLLEDWSSASLKVTGSFIQLFRSKYATGLWNANYYKEPKLRDWKYESRFVDLESLPPGFEKLFPSVSCGQAYSSWRKISKDEAMLSAK